VLAAVLTAGLLSAGLTAQAADASSHADSRAVADRASGQPAVGQCRHLSTAQVHGASNTSSAISCNRSHNSRVIAVPSLPKGVTWGELKSKSKLYSMAVRLCFPAYADAVGQSNPVRDQTAYTWFFFEPTQKQRSAGQRWIRCDLGFQHATSYAALPTDRAPALNDASPPNKVSRCLRKVKKQYLTTPCTASHSYRAAGSFSVGGKKYPGTTTLLQRARSRCPDIVRTDTDFRFTWSSETVWNRGPDHVIVCYNHTSK